MKNKILIYSDFDSKSGFGHLSRAQVFFDAVDHDLYEIHLSSELNPRNFGVKFRFLEKTIWKPFREATTEKYLLVFVDTYDSNIIQKLKNWDVDKKILLLDSNFAQTIPYWPDLVIDLERITPRLLGASTRYIHGITLIGSAIQRLQRGDCLNSGQLKFPSKVVINFGGSNQVLKFLRKFNSIFKTQIDVQFVVFCSSDIYLDLEIFLDPYKNATAKLIGDDYFGEMINCDLLVTNSGSSFLEAIFMKIPTAIFDLFKNASLNFETFRMCSNVLYAGRVEDLDSDWFDKLSLNYRKSKSFEDNKRFEDQFQFIDIETLRSSISSIL